MTFEQIVRACKEPKKAKEGIIKGLKKFISENPKSYKAQAILDKIERGENVKLVDTD